ncbi:MAG: NUDIX domain-containing protein [Candidatus Paceibacterota bacterium]|jgi:8-oxo-dGTP pyrophosphatase MutT (NUDIX family)
MEIFDRKYAGALLVTSRGGVLMQRRDDKIGIQNPGLVTTFGGLVETGEKPEQTLLRELKEEVSLSLSAQDVSFFKIFNKNKETHGEDTTCYIYLVKNFDQGTIEVREGQGYIEVSKNDDLNRVKLSRLAREILEEYFHCES